jgi:hypothetical protein
MKIAPANDLGRLAPASEVAGGRMPQNALKLKCISWGVTECGYSGFSGYSGCSEST